GVPAVPHRLTALPDLPEPLAPLAALARGIAAEWDDQLAGLFRALAPDSAATAPLALLAAASPERLAPPAAHGGFLEAGRGGGRARVGAPRRDRLVHVAPGRAPAVDRVPVAGVRRQRRAAPVLGRARGAGGRPSEGRQRPRRAAGRGRALLPRRLLPAAP